MTSETYCGDIEVMKFMYKCCCKLTLNSLTTATSCHLYHRFYQEHSHKEYDSYTIASTAIYLATKVEEQHTRLRDIVNVCHHTMFPDKPVLELDSHFWNLRDTIASLELLLLRVLQFNVVVNHPHKHMLHYLMTLSKLFRTKEWERSGVSNASWAFLKDSYLSNFYMQYSPKLHAVAVIDLAVQCCKLKLPDYATNWHVSVCTDNMVTADTVKSFQTQLVTVINQANANMPNTIDLT